MHDDIAHFRVIDGLLCGAAPCFFSAVEVRVNADDVKVGRIDEVEILWIFDPATEYKM